MTTTEGQPEMSPAAPLGAVPQAATASGSSRVNDFVASIDPSESLRLLSRSGDTEVIFRLNRDLPLWRQATQLGAERLRCLSVGQRLMSAGGLVVALGALAVILPGSSAAPQTAAPPVATTAAVPAPSPVSPVPAAAPEPDPAPALAQPLEAPPPAVASAPAAPKPAIRPVPKRTRANAAPAGRKQATSPSAKKALKPATAAAANRKPARHTVVPARW